MTAYEAPIQNLAIFDVSAFTENDTPLTVATGSKYFLKYPNAQSGTETLQAVNINGLLDVNANSTFSGRIVQDNTSSVERQITTSYCNISRTSNTTSQNGDSRMFMLSDVLYIVNETGATPSIVFNFTLPSPFSALTLSPTFTVVARNLVMADSLISNREMTCGKMNFSDYTSLSNPYTSTMVLYNASGTSYLQNLVNNGSINLVTRSSGGVDENIVSIRNTGINFAKSIGLADIAGSGTTSTIVTDSSLLIPGMVYDCNVNSGFHIFKTNDSGGVETAPVYFGSNLTSISNTLLVRNLTVTTNRLDIVTDNNTTTVTTTMRLRCATASQTSKISISCDSVSAGGVVTNNPVLTLESSKGCAFIIPPDTTTMNNPTTTSQCGNVVNSGVAFFSKPTSPTIFNVDSVSLPRGTYNISFSYSLQNVGTALTFNQFTMGLGTTASVTDIDGSIFQTCNLSITNNSAKIEIRNVSATWRNTSAGNSTIYFNGICDYTGGQLNIKNNYNIVRII